jgi:hypothetical protein
MYSVLTGREFKVFTTVRHEMGQDISGACGQLALKKGPSCGSAVGGGSGGGTGDIEDLGGVVSKAKDGSGLRRRGGSHRKEGVMDDDGRLVENKEEKKGPAKKRRMNIGGRRRVDGWTMAPFRTRRTKTRGSSGGRGGRGRTSSLVLFARGGVRVVHGDGGVTRAPALDRAGGGLNIKNNNQRLAPSPL